MTSITINFNENAISASQQVDINSIITIDSSFVDMSYYLNKDDFGALIKLEHHQMITSLNLTEVSPYLLLFFDDDLFFKGASYSIKNGNGNSTLQTQYKNILFLRLPHNIELNQINNLHI